MSAAWQEGKDVKDAPELQRGRRLVLKTKVSLQVNRKCWSLFGSSGGRNVLPPWDTVTL